MTGPRLPYVIRKLEGTVPVKKHDYDPREGKIVETEERADAGWLAFFPQGHWLHIPNLELLKKYKLAEKPLPIGDDGPLDLRFHPNIAFENLEAAVVSHVKRVCGPIDIPGFEGTMNLPKPVTEDNYVTG